MNSVRRSRRWGSALVWMILATAALSGPVSAQFEGPPLMRETGLRAGGGDGFDAFEWYYRQSAPALQRGVLDRIGLSAWNARWDLVGGLWSGSHRDTAVIAVGPAFERRLAASGLRFSLGLQPTLISRDDGNGKDLGGPFQFTSHAGLAWAPPGGLIIGLRVQHTSNAGIYDNNPGVDLVLGEIGFPF